MPKKDQADYWFNLALKEEEVLIDLLDRADHAALRLVDRRLAKENIEHYLAAAAEIENARC